MIGGGGTGGHIFPAIAIANAIKENDREAEILFIGAKDRMEMEKVPAAGYVIKGLPVMGLKRSLSLQNIKVIWNLIYSFILVCRYIKEFRPDVVIGVGGYASAPLLRMAVMMGIPALIQEQNSYAGVTNRWLSGKVKKICVAYDNMDKYFPSSKIIFTGNPVRPELEKELPPKDKALDFFEIKDKKPVILILGGSLGALTINQAVSAGIEQGLTGKYNIIWQTGRNFIEKAKSVIPSGSGVRAFDFISRMDMAYSAADIIISRAGAGTISELCIIGKQVILIPSPNVAEDHQSKNAQALVDKEAAVMIKDTEAVEKLWEVIEELMNSPEKMKVMALNIRKCAKKQAAARIAAEVSGLVYKNIFFLGIGGIGMSAIARYYNYYGYNVYGYDRTETPLTKELSKEGINVHYCDDVNNIPAIFRKKPRECLVIYTPAIPDSSEEKQWFTANGYLPVKRAAVLGEITRQKKSIAISGTHGKTSVSTMTANILKQSALGCNAFMGGISKNYGTNLLLDQTSEYVVVEADEYDRSFLNLSPYIALVTAIDPDHLDIYGTPENVRKAFEDFTRRIVPGGILISKSGLDLTCPDGVTGYTYSLSDISSDFFAANIIEKEGVSTFDITTPYGIMKDIVTEVPGFVNIENTVAAVAVAVLSGVPEENIRSAVSGFSGVKRRFEMHIKSPIVYIDDYAHHPEELKATIRSVKRTWPGKKITGVFQPHLYSRTADLASGFAEVLSELDTLILLDIYPARELPIEGVSSKIIYDKVTAENKYMLGKDDVVRWLSDNNVEVLITFGAGDIDTIVEPVKSFLTEKYVGG